jgi:hypothetical protein
MAFHSIKYNFLTQFIKIITKNTATFNVPAKLYSQQRNPAAKMNGKTRIKIINFENFLNRY